MLTVFTPTYNRGYILHKLYESLCAQTCRDFEWVIVDDGSDDNTGDLVRAWQAEGRIDIRYHRQPNGGKHRAINRGVAMARGTLFFIVDSDDHLKPDAAAWILKSAGEIKDDSGFAGIAGLRIRPDGSKIGGGNDFGTIDADAMQIRYVHNIKGDLAEVFKSETIRKYPFPDIAGEKFCSEGLIWNRMALEGLKLRYHYKGIYVCEYLDGGLTDSRNRCRYDSPGYSMLLYSEAIKNTCIDVKTKIKYALLFWRFSKNSKKRFLQKAAMLPVWAILLWPFGKALQYSKL